MYTSKGFKPRGRWRGDQLHHIYTGQLHSHICGKRDVNSDSCRGDQDYKEMGGGIHDHPIRLPEFQKP